MRSRYLDQIPYGFLLLLAFYPLMKEALSSILIGLFLLSAVILNPKGFRIRYNEYELRPLLINTAFYVALILSVFYSESWLVGIQKLQSSLLIIIFPLVVFYFLPAVGRKTLRNFSLAFIVANLGLCLYFYILLVKGLEIDRIPGLTGSGILTQFEALMQYPYEFVLSKAEKHLVVLYESHKVYLSLNFLVAIILCFRLAFKSNFSWVLRLLLGGASILFVLAVLYSQALISVVLLLLFLVVAPFIYFNSVTLKLIAASIILFFIFLMGQFGFVEQYENKNTEITLRFLEQFGVGNPGDKNIDKRAYIYKCALHLVGEKPIFGYGIGDVQQELDNCYVSRDYTVAEYKSVGSPINAHNYYLHVWLAAGLPGILLLLTLFFNNMYLAFAKKEFTYFFFLFIFLASMLTENVLSRMWGVFLFVIFNTLFFSNLNKENE